MLNLRIKLPFFNKERQDKIKLDDLLDYLNHEFERELSATESEGRRRCEEIYALFNETEEMIKRMQEKRAFNRKIHEFDVVAIPEEMNFSGLSNFLLISTNHVKKINSLSPTPMALEKYKNEIKDIGTNVSLIFKKIDDFQAFMKNSEVARNYNLISKEIEEIKDLKRQLEVVSKRETDEKTSLKSTIADIGREIKKLMEGNEVRGYKLLKEREKSLEMDLADTKNEVSVIFASVRRPFKKIGYKLGKRADILEECLTFPLDCILKNVDVFSDVNSLVSEGMGFIEKGEIKCGRGEVNNLLEFRKAFTNEFVDNIRARINSIENERENLNREIKSTSGVFEEIRKKESEKTRMEKALSKQERDNRDDEEHTKRLRLQIEEKNSKLERMVSDVLGYKVFVTFS